MQIVRRALLLVAMLLAFGPLAFAQAPAASRPGTATIAGQLKTVDGKIADEVRVSALSAPPPNVRPEDGIQYYIAPPPVRTVMSDKEGVTASVTCHRDGISLLQESLGRTPTIRTPSTGTARPWSLRPPTCR